MGAFVGIVFDGLAYGSLLFLISAGLSITLGVMRFVNLAHGAFAMLGGYAAVELVNQLGVPFLGALPLVFVGSALLGLAAESTLYRRLYAADPLRQVLLTIGVAYVASAGATFVWGPVEQPFELPAFLQGRWQVLGVELGVYRVFLVGVVAALTGALYYWVECTRFGARLRAAVDNPVAAAGMGIPVDRVFQWTFAIGTGLAGLGGALGIDVLGLEPGFGLKYLVYFLLVVAVGGEGSVIGTVLASLSLGVADVLGKYYVPELGGFLIYALMVAALLIWPGGMRGKAA